MITFEQCLNYQGEIVELVEHKNGFAKVKWTDLEGREHDAWAEAHDVYISDMCVNQK